MSEEDLPGLSTSHWALHCHRSVGEGYLWFNGDFLPEARGSFAISDWRFVVKPLLIVRMIRASLAGTCYPAQRRELLDFVRGWFDQDGGAPWVLDGKTKSASTFRGVVSPHIDFRVNTSVYAQAFAPWLQAPPADKVLVLGVGHRSRLEWSLNARSYETPLGIVKSDRRGLEFLADVLPKEVWGDARGHTGEHSIEFPLICLQALRELRGITSPFEFVPVLCGGLFEYLRMDAAPEKDALLFQLGAALRQWWLQAEADGHRVEVIVSIDGCHMGPRFGHEYWVDEPRLAECNDWEDALWTVVAKGELGPFLHFLQQDANARYFDGVGALALLMAMFGREAVGMIERTGYAQWFEKRDGSAVTFSSARISR